MKFLDSDDQLDPTCVAELVELFEEAPSIGMAFCRLRIIYDEGGEDPDWFAVWGKPHEFSGPLEQVNDGSELLRRWFAARFPAGWIGPPSVVMVRRSAFDRVGGFSRSQVTRCDTDLWARLLPDYGVGYRDAELVTYLHGSASETIVSHTTNRYWLDRAATLEMLYSDPRLRRDYPELRSLVRGARREAWRTVAKLGYGADGRRYPTSPYGRYVALRVRLAAQRLT